jgi:hypothetical protein
MCSDDPGVVELNWRDDLRVVRDSSPGELLRLIFRDTDGTEAIPPDFA